MRNLNHQHHHQRQEQIEEEEEEEKRNRSSSSSHVHYTQPFTTLSVPIMSSSNYEVAEELTWENGQLAMLRLSGGCGLVPRVGGDTLESIVHQAATSCPNPIPNNLDHKIHNHNHHPTNMDSLVPSSSEKCTENNTSNFQMGLKPIKKRSRLESGHHSNSPNGHVDLNASARSAFFRDTDTNMRTFTSSGYSPSSLKTKNIDEDSNFHGRPENQDEECDLIKTEPGRSHSSRRSRVAEVHNQSERKRRDRINQKMKALQKLVPNSNKTDKASMLDEVINYLKQLQSQIQMIQNVRNNMPQHPQMLMPSTAMGIQQQLHQMSLLTRMTGMGFGGIGMGMLDMGSLASSAASVPVPSLLQPTRPPPAMTTTAPTFVPPPFLVPQMMQTHMNMPVPGTGRTERISNPSLPMPPPDPYCTAFLQQAMNMDLYNKMTAFYKQQFNWTTQTTDSSPPQTKNVRNRD